MEDGLEQQDSLADVLAGDAGAPNPTVPEAPTTAAADVAMDALPEQATAEAVAPTEHGAEHAPATDEDGTPQDAAPSDAAALVEEDRRFNERLNMSEAMLREQHGDAEVEAKLALFQREAARDPGLRAALRQQAHPWAWMYRQAQRMQALEEIGTDPDAYRSRVRDEVRAELAGPAQAASRAVPRPAQRGPSLAAGRSSAPRGTAAWSGPAPLGDILRR